MPIITILSFNFFLLFLCTCVSQLFSILHNFNFMLFYPLFVRELSLLLYNNIIFDYCFFVCVSILSLNTLFCLFFLKQLYIITFSLEVCVPIIEYCVLNLYCSASCSLKNYYSIFPGVLTRSNCDAAATANTTANTLSTQLLTNE